MAWFYAENSLCEFTSYLYHHRKSLAGHNIALFSKDTNGSFTCLTCQVRDMAEVDLVTGLWSFEWKFQMAQWPCWIALGFQSSILCEPLDVGSLHPNVKRLWERMHSILNFGHGVVVWAFAILASRAHYPTWWARSSILINVLLSTSNLYPRLNTMVRSILLKFLVPVH